MSLSEERALVVRQRRSFVGERVPGDCLFGASSFDAEVWQVGNDSNLKTANLWAVLVLMLQIVVRLLAIMR
jgi:hypothetical protein